ncbi:MAG: hypothetical protein JSS29_07870 [Proteobacteria bacterium]|nr:hypothetical protein [Pseudomonadota bacterium]
MNGGASRRLVGWKSIGQYLGCTERTARRWEAVRGLPVHRIPGEGRRSVWAHTQELSDWLEALSPEAQESLRSELDPAPESALIAAVAPAEADIPAAPAPMPALPPPDLPVAPPVPAPERRWPAWRAAALVLGVLLVIAGALDFMRGRPNPYDGVRTAYDDNAQARATYLNARYELSTRSSSGLIAAEQGFRELVEHYPERAAGWSGLAESYLLLREFGSMTDQEAYPQAERAARAAIALDPKAATAWLDEAFITWWWRGDSDQAFSQFDTALRLEPGSARAHHWLATALAARGDFTRALEEIARARALSPENRAIIADEAYLRFGAGQEGDAVATLERLTQLDPGFEAPHYYLSRIYLLSGRYPEFLHEAETAAQLRGQDDVLAQLRGCEQGLKSYGPQALVAQLAATEADRWAEGKGSAVQVAQYRALARDRAGAMHWLEVAADGQDPNLRSLVAYPEFSAYRKDPEFVAIANRLPQSAPLPGEGHAPHS